MAAKKKKKAKKKFVGKKKNPTDQEQYRELLVAMLEGAINAVRLYDTRVNGQLQFEIDEEVDDE